MSNIKTINQLSLISIFVFLVSSFCSSQSILWEYDLDVDIQGHVGNFWIDDDQIHFNITNYDMDYLLALDKEGSVQSLTYFNDCKQHASIFPFKDNKFLSIGLNCWGHHKGGYDVRLFSNNGDQIDQFSGLEKASYRTMRLRQGYFFTAKPYEFGYSDITHGYVDWNVNVRQSKISIESLKREGLGIIPSRGLAQLTNKTIVQGFDYGKVNGNQMSGGRYGSVLVGIKDDKIKWTYPEEPDKHGITVFKAYKNKLGLLRWGTCLNDQFELLDSYGNLLESFNLKEAPKDLILQQGRIIFLFRHYIASYSYKGEILETFEYDPEESMDQSRFKMLDEDSFIITGFGSESKEPIIRMVSLINDMEEDKDIPIIASIDEVASNIRSVSVFPNPASIEVNFKIDGDVLPDEEFNAHIFSSDGKSLMVKSVTETQFSLDISNLPSGQYFYRLMTKNPKSKDDVFSGKFIKVE